MLRPQEYVVINMSKLAAETTRLIHTEMQWATSYPTYPQ